MSVEHIINQQHFKNHAANNEGVQLEAIKQSLVNEKVEEKKAPRVNIKDDRDASTIQKLLSQQSEKAKHNITKQSFDKMQENNPSINEALEDQLENEIDRFFNKKPTSFDDQVELSSQKSTLRKNEEEPDAFQFSKQSSIQSKNKQKEKVEKKLANLIEESSEDEDTAVIKRKETSNKESLKNAPKTMQQLDSKELKQLATMVSKYAVSQDSNIKQQIEKKQQQLTQKGVSPKDIHFVTAKVGLLVKEHMVYDLKQKLINMHMSKGFSRQETVQHSIDFSQNANKLNSLSNGTVNIAKNPAEILAKLQHQAKQDLGNFLYEESIHQFTKQSLGQISLKEFTDELIRLQKAAQSAGVVISEKDLTDRICAAIDHLGLGEFTPPNANDQNEKEKEPERLISQEEALDDKLRYLYMIKALHPSLRNKIDVHFKMKKCRNGMIKLGFYTEEKEDLLKKQGEFLAAKQFTEELEFIYREEATLPHLSGPEYGVLRKKKAFFISQLRKINHGPSQKELDRIKDNAYQDIYSLVKEKVLQLEDMVEIHKNVAYSRQLKKYKEVIKRISSDIMVNDHQFNIDQLTAPIKRSTINEGA